MDNARILRQTEELDRYWEALMTGRTSAAAPSALDPEVAAMARRLQALPGRPRSIRRYNERYGRN